MASHAVECRHLFKSFSTASSSVTALAGVNLAVEQGELHMIVGPSGCGKTTLISVVAGILTQDSGTCIVLGQVLNQMSQREKALFRGKSVGFVFQAFNLIPTLTVAENVAVPLIVNGYSHKDSFREAARLLSRVGLEDRISELPNRLSGGQQQRVAIARALIHSPKIVVCDEPTSALDHENGMKILSLFRELSREHQVTLIIVTHDSRIYRFADRVSLMDDGKVVAVRSGADAVEKTL